MRSADTDPEAERAQLELLRAASVSQRLALALSLTDTTLELARRAFRDAHSTMNPDDLAVRWVAHLYGQELAERFREALRSHQLPRAS